MHGRSQRPADRSLAAPGGGPSDAAATARPGLTLSLGTTRQDYRAALWADQTTRRLSAMDGMGIGRRQDPVDDGLCGLEPAKTLPALASRAWAGKRKSVGRHEPENGDSRVKAIWRNPKSTHAVVAEAIGLASRTESSPANRFPLCLRPHPIKKLLRQSPPSRPFVPISRYRIYHSKCRWRRLQTAATIVG